ncbi:hypothetical protein KYK29_05345 [Shinella daejeonensis]|nr:hypothetical protein [Shinella daejeonensis]
MKAHFEEKELCLFWQIVGELRQALRDEQPEAVTSYLVDELRGMFANAARDEAAAKVDDAGEFVTAAQETTAYRMGRWGGNFVRSRRGWKRSARLHQIDGEASPPRGLVPAGTERAVARNGNAYNVVISTGTLVFARMSVGGTVETPAGVGDFSSAAKFSGMAVPPNGGAAIEVASLLARNRSPSGSNVTGDWLMYLRIGGAPLRRCGVGIRPVCIRGRQHL